MADLVAPDRVVPALYAANKLQVIEKLSCIAARRSGVDFELVQHRARDARGSSRGFELQRRSPDAMPLRQGTLRAGEAWLIASITSEMLSCRRGDDGGRYDKKKEGLVSITVGNNDYA